MMKKFFGLASAIVFSFSISVAAAEVSAPVAVTNQEMLTALVAANEAVAKLSPQEVEAIVQSLKTDKDLAANNDTVNALLEQVQALSGTEIGSITIGMIAVAAVAYYALPALYNGAIKPACGWVKRGIDAQMEARAQRRQLAKVTEEKRD